LSGGVRCFFLVRGNARVAKALATGPRGITAARERDASTPEPRCISLDVLAVFAPKPATFSLEAAMAVAQIERTIAVRGLQELVSRGSIEAVGDTRFARVDALAAGSALDRLDPARDRHAAYYLGFVNQRRSDWQAIEAEWPQLAKAWTWVARDRAQDPKAISFAHALRVYFERHALSAQVVEWNERALSVARSRGLRGEEAAILNHLASAHVARQSSDRALECYELALEILHVLGDHRGEGATFRNLGSLFWQKREHAKALAYC
jgi:tetratricopeptide (TPR) repeat protein